MSTAKKSPNNVRLQYLAGNQCSAFVFRDCIVPMNGRWLFTEREDAEEAAAAEGFVIDKDTWLVTPAPPPPYVDPRVQELTIRLDLAKNPNQTRNGQLNDLTLFVGECNHLLNGGALEPEVEAAVAALKQEALTFTVALLEAP